MAYLLVAIGVAFALLLGTVGVEHERANVAAARVASAEANLKVSTDANAALQRDVDGFRGVCQKAASDVAAIAKADKSAADATSKLLAQIAREASGQQVKIDQLTAAAKKKSTGDTCANANAAATVLRDLAHDSLRDAP